MTSPARAARLLVLGLALAATAPARAEDAPTPSGASGSSGAAGPSGGVAAHASLDQIEETYDEFEKEARSTIRKRRYEAILGYVRANPSARDAEEARSKLLHLATEAEAWDRALLHAEEYLAAHPGGAHQVEARFAKAQALDGLERVAEAKAAYEALTRLVSLQRHGRAVVVAAFTRKAQYYAEVGDAEGAKVAWRELKAAAQQAPDAAAVARMADGEIASLDLIGRPAKPMPADARDLEGRPVSLADYRGKVVLVDFWATWCGPCVKEMPALLQTWRAWNARGFEVLGVSMDTGADGQKVRDFVASRGLPWRTVFYPGSRNPAGEAYDVRALPHTVLIGRGGQVLAVGARGKELERAVAAAIASGK